MSQPPETEQPAAAASAAQKEEAATSVQPVAPSAPINHVNLVLTALTAGLFITIGLWNALVVVVVAMLLVCNPWVRTLLELPSTDGKHKLSAFDPARFLLSNTPSSATKENGASQAEEYDLSGAASEDDPLMQTEQLYSLTVMPDPLRESSQTMIRFIIRDFVQGWYDNLTFAHPNFPISAEANISHTAASIYLRSRQLKSTNTAAEILLTVQSVVLSSLRRRRGSTQSPWSTASASPSRLTWPSTAARIDALRKAIRKFLSRNLSHAERSSPLVMLLLTEILAKQAWQVVQTIGDPDFINQKIVEFAEPASETSLEGQTISPEELERLASLDATALDIQTPETLHTRSDVADQPASADYAASPAKAPPLPPRSAQGDPSRAHSPTASRGISAQASHHSSPEAFANHNSSSQQPIPFDRSKAESRTSYATSSRPGGVSDRPRPRVTPPRKSSSGPLSALGGFATGALGALADAAERAVDVVGGTVDEFGNLLMVPADPSSRNQNSPNSNNENGAASPRRRYALLAEREQDELRDNRGSQSHNTSGSTPDSSAPAYHLDVPSGVDEPPLPASLQQSLRANDPHSVQQPLPSSSSALSNTGNDTGAFKIPETPERPSMDAPSIVAPAPVAAALNFPTRDSFSIDERKEDEEASFVAMQQLLSDRTSPAYEAFENFLEQPNNRFCAPNEGESLLRLHTQLNTLASIMEFATLDDQTFRADASTILSKALEQLPSNLPPTHDGQRPVLVRRSAQQVLTNLEWCANMDVVEPLRENIIARLVQLYNAYLASGGQQAPSSHLQSVQSSPKARFSATLPRTESPEPNQLHAFLDRENRPSFSSMDSEQPAMRYEPRRKTTAPSAGVTSGQHGMQTPPRAPSVPPGPGGAPVAGPPLGPSRPMSVPPRVPSAPPRTQQMMLPGTTSSPPVVAPAQVHRSSTELPPTQVQAEPSAGDAQLLASNKTVISVNDISPNAESNRSVDVRTFEVVISVEGISERSDSNPDGFVLVRRWHEFEQMDAEIKRQPRSSHPLPRLPTAKGRRSAEVCRLLEAYVFELLLPGNSAQLAGVASAKRFFDRTRAGASAEDLRRKGGAGAFLGGIGKGIVSGVGIVGKQAAVSGIQALQNSASARISDASQDGLSPHRAGSTSSDAPVPGLGLARSSEATGPRFLPPNSPIADSASSTTSAFVSRTNSPSPSPSRRPPRDASVAPLASSRPSSELSARQLDLLLSSIFAVADEAFNLQGSWTLRRGMLRVLEQVVRTTYASSIVAAFNNSAASLNASNFAKWIADLTNSLWPNGRRWGSEIGTVHETKPRSRDDKAKTHERAREIVVSYAPAQAGYLLGPGGKVACVKALAEVHATLMDPITACDLGLTVVLKALDMASR